MTSAPLIFAGRHLSPVAVPRLLHHNSLGYVAHCPSTGYLQVCFGTLALGTTRTEYADLRHCVCQMADLIRARPASDCACAHCAAEHDPEARRISLRTPLDRLALVLTRAELFAFEHLLDTAALLLEAEILLGLARPTASFPPEAPRHSDHSAASARDEAEE